MTVPNSAGCFATPTPSCPSADFESSESERARQREIAAYLSAASFPPGLHTGFAETPGITPDPILNALTQLGALRLGVDRAFVSLIDRQHQYVVCEMTRTHSLVGMKADPGNHIGIGVIKIRNSDGVCPATMKAFMDETGEWVRTGPDVVANRTRYIVNDFRAHPNYMNRAYVTGYPFFRSYLEVPLVSPLGYLLGSYCVVDSGLNDFDNDHVVGVLNEVAAAIMDHLENVRIRQSRDRAGQLIRELSGFIRHEPAAQRPEPFRDTGQSGSQRPPGPAPSIDALSSDSSRRRPTLSTAQSSRESEQSGLSLTSPRQEGSETPPTTPRDEPGNPMDELLLGAMAETGAQEASLRAPSVASNASEPHGFISSVNIKTTFFNAAATIRRSMDLDGLMFLDAVPSSYVDRPDQLAIGGETPTDLDGPFCAAIVKSALGPGGESVTHSTQVQLPEVSLQRFIRAYPDGHVFTADELGPIDDSYGVGKPFQPRPAEDRESVRLRNDIAALFRVLPAAKYVIFLPMWHFQRECWYAAALGWVEDPMRSMDVADLGLVAAFGNSVMAEVSRLEALAASRAKSDFVSSLSHELRSPLHGIMGSSELLREAIADRSLLSVLDMLDSCATTLLDTFNNLLDHAIVTHAGLSVSEVRVADLGALVEDVVEVVRVGHLSRNAMDPQAALHRRKPYPAARRPPGHHLLITVQIEKHPWRLPLSVGAWKRIVMNIFGNAYKYTSAGRIEVGLRVVKRTDRAGNTAEYISFTVEDTGAGMSSDYLKYHLFTPFSQEDSHAPGMGLGLSIVQQLVSDLGGTINVKSSLGIGTLVEVLVPLKDEPAWPSEEAKPASISFDKQPDNFSDLGGRTLCIVTADACAAVAGPGLVISKDARHWSGLVEKAIRTNAGAFLGMDVVLGTRDCPDPPADVYIMDCNAFVGEANCDNILQAWQARVAPLVLLCPGSGQECLKQQITKGGIHLHHPIGPRKLASVFRIALEAGQAVAEQAPRPPEIQNMNPSTLLETRPSLSLTLPIRNKTIPLLGLQPHTTTEHPPPTITATEQPPPEPIPNTIPAESKPPETPAGHHLLLVDDNPINIKVLSHLVRRLDHTFATAANGLEAVQLYADSLEGQGPRFDVVFMDISMPVMNGFEATREIRLLEARAGARRCRVVALTGLSSEVNQAEASACGVDLFLTKPIKGNTIRAVLAEEQGGRFVGTEMAVKSGTCPEEQ